jgi:hypothetical protein
MSNVVSGRTAAYPLAILKGDYRRPNFCNFLQHRGVLHARLHTVTP